MQCLKQEEKLCCEIIMWNYRNTSNLLLSHKNNSIKNISMKKKKHLHGGEEGDLEKPGALVGGGVMCPP